MEAIQREQHAAYMRDLRQSRDYKDRENKLRVLGRISEGSVPHVYSLTKHNITRDDINDLRRRNGFDDLIENIPYWAEATRSRRRNMEDPSSYVPEAPPAQPATDLPDRVGTAGDANKEAFSVKAINIHFRTKGRDIGTKTNQRAKQGTISRQFGPPNSGEKSGSFARFMEFLGPRYLEDARELLGRNTLRRIETEMTKKHKKDRKPAPGQSEFIQLSTMVKLLETVLIVLREYPPFDALCRVPGKSDDDCEEPAQESVKKRYEEIDALFNKYDAQVNAANLAKPKEGVRVLPFKEIKRRVERAFPRNSQEIPKQNLYINMYAEFVSRDDMKNEHSCALLTDGKMKCWGRNDVGQLGDGTTTSSSTPVEVSNIKTATSIALGGYHSCALLTDGAMKCWGNNDQGQLGDGTTTNRATPVEASGITTATSIALGYSHSCALLTDGKIKCWGRNDYGQLGDGTTTSSSTPVEVSGITTATSIDAGWGNS